MRFTDQDMHSASAGRGVRYVHIQQIENVRILTDVSSVEVFVNDGEYVFTTRYYPEKASVCMEAEGADIELSAI